LEQFVAAAQGNVDRRFWDSIYKWQGSKGSGSPHVTGWIFKFFPYLDNPDAKRARLYGEASTVPLLRRNPWLSTPPAGGGPGRDDIPSLPAKAPFVWRFVGADYQMEFVGGLMGISQNPTTLCLRPEIGWAVRAA
jgi:hypothetical protein